MLSSNTMKREDIEEIIELEKERYLEKNDIKIYIKSKTLEYISNNLIISGRFLSDEEYSYIMQHTSYVFMPYDIETYKYRVSGVYFDALTFSKPIIFFGTMFFKNQVSKFGELGLEISSTIKNELIHDAEKYCSYRENINKAKEYYADINIQEDLDKLF